MVKQRLKFWITNKSVEDWVNIKKIFFILSMGRSGTKFLAMLLNKAPGAFVVHEPVLSDFRAYKDAFFNTNIAYRYIKNFRMKEIYLRNRKLGFNIYGEVNSVLRRHYKALKHFFPKSTFIHLIRDGRDVVRSGMSRNAFKRKDRNTKNIHPIHDDPWKEKWPEMNRFEKISWYWQEEIHCLSKNIKNTVKFEEIISNYNYFKKKILEPLNLDVPKEIWQEEVNKPKNITPKYLIPHWKEWNEDMKNSFTRICGDVMKANGY